MRTKHSSTAAPATAAPRRKPSVSDRRSALVMTGWLASLSHAGSADRHRRLSSRARAAAAMTRRVPGAIPPAG
jgi:hypothetical protein